MTWLRNPFFNTSAPAAEDSSSDDVEAAKPRENTMSGSGESSSEAGDPGETSDTAAARIGTGQGEGDVDADVERAISTAPQSRTGSRGQALQPTLTAAEAAEIAGATAVEAARTRSRGAIVTTADPHLRIREPSKKLTVHQFFYIFILDGLGAVILSGGINFAIAYAMYHAQDPVRHPVRLFELPNTLAGDAGVTTIIQSIITWLIELALVNRDLRTGSVQPIGFIPEPTNRWARWFCFLDRTRQLHEPGTLGHWAFFLFSQVLRGFLICIPAFCLTWGPAVGILTAVGTRRGGDWYFDRVWAPQVFKLILGGVLGFLITPLTAMFWLTRCGWAIQTNQRHYGER